MNKTNKAELIFKRTTEINLDWLCDLEDYDEFTSQVNNLTEAAHDYILANFDEQFASVVEKDSYYTDFFRPLGDIGLLKVEPAIVAPGVLRLRYNRYLTYNRTGTFTLLAHVSDEAIECSDVRALAYFESLGKDKHTRLVDLYRFSNAAMVAASCNEFRELVLFRSELLKEFLCATCDIYGFVQCMKVDSPHTQMALALYRSGLVYAECDVSATAVGIRSGFCNIGLDLGVDFFMLANAYSRDVGRASEEDTHRAATYFMMELQEQAVSLLNMLLGVSTGSGGFIGSKHTQLQEIRTQLPVCTKLLDCFRELM